MPVDSAGNAVRPASPIPVTGQNADAPQVNSPIDDIYSILNMMTFRDGRAPLRGNISMNGYKATGSGEATGPGDLVSLAQVQALIATIGVPTGALMPLTGSTIPAGWVLANGQSLLRATYPTYWAWVQASGNLAATEAAKTHGQYGPGDGSTTFTVPNLTADGGQFIRPMASGRTIGSVQADEVKAHGHTATFSGNQLPAHRHSGVLVSVESGGPQLGNGNTLAVTSTTSFETAGTPTGSVSVASGGGTESRPKNIAYPVLIKT